MSWEVNIVKQNFSELIRKAEREEPQIITRHGEEVAVVLSVEAYRNLIRQSLDKRTSRRFCLKALA